MFAGAKSTKTSEKKLPQQSGINLLPPEVIAQQKQLSKQNFANRFSVGTLVLLVFITGIVFALRLMQDSSAQQVEDTIAHAQDQIGSLQEREGVLVSLKNKLGSIQTLISGDTKANVFTSVLNQAPADMKLSLITVEKSGVMLLTLSSPSVASIESFLVSLQDPAKLSFKVTKIDLDSFSKGKDGLYRMNLKVVPEALPKK
jgi:hypothetical protein